MKFFICSNKIQLFLKFSSDLFQNEDENFPSLHDMYKNVSLVFCNSHFSEASVNAHVPALVEIGGIQVKDKPNPLPKVCICGATLASLDLLSKII